MWPIEFKNIRNQYSDFYKNNAICFGGTENKVISQASVILGNIQITKSQLAPNSKVYTEYHKMEETLQNSINMLMSH